MIKSKRNNKLIIIIYVTNIKYIITKKKWLAIPPIYTKRTIASRLTEHKKNKTYDIVNKQNTSDGL